MIIRPRGKETWLWRIVHHRPHSPAVLLHNARWQLWESHKFQWLWRFLMWKFQSYQMWGHLSPNVCVPNTNSSFIVTRHQWSLVIRVIAHRAEDVLMTANISWQEVCRCGCTLVWPSTPFPALESCSQIPHSSQHYCSQKPEEEHMNFSDDDTQQYVYITLILFLTPATAKYSLSLSNSILLTTLHGLLACSAYESFDSSRNDVNLV